MDVQVVTSNAKLAVVSTVVDGVEIRKVIPAEQVVNGQVEQTDFDSGVDFGLPLTDIVQPAVHTPEELTALIVAAMHNAGLWEAEDFKNARHIYGALQAVYGQDVAAIRRAVQEYVAKQVGETLPTPVRRIR